METDSVDVVEKADSKLDPKQQSVYDWRLECFESLGFYGPIAEALAGSTADLGRARKMHSKSCSLATMLRILM